MWPRRLRSFAVAAIAVGALLELLGGLQPYRPFEFSALIVTAVLVGDLASRQSFIHARGIATPAFVINFVALLLFVLVDGWTLIVGMLLESFSIS